MSFEDVEPVEDLVIEKCVIYLRAEESATVHKGGDVSLRSLLPVSLPKLKCLEGDSKYLPYQESVPGVVYVDSEQAVKNTSQDKSHLIGRSLTPMQQNIYDLFTSGERSSEIAKKLKISPGTVYSQIRQAKAKLGEPAPEYVQQRQTRESYMGKPLSSKENEIYQLFLSGLIASQIGERVGIDRKKVNDALRRAKWKLGTSYGKK